MSTHNIFVTLGASNHTDHDRADFDYYATHPSAAEMLLRMESFSHKIWEPACGEKHLSNVFERHGYEVRSSDIVDRCGNEVLDFLSMENTEPWEGDIITNPPFKYAMDFIERSLQLVTEGHKVAMFVRLQFLEGKSRKSLYINTPPQFVYVSSSRIICAANGNFEKISGSATAYCWIVWTKGYKGPTTLKWFN